MNSFILLLFTSSVWLCCFCSVLWNPSSVRRSAQAGRSITAPLSAMHYGNLTPEVVEHWLLVWSYLLLLSCPSFLTTLTLPGCWLIPSSLAHNAPDLFLGLPSPSFSQAQLWLWTDSPGKRPVCEAHVWSPPCDGLQKARLPRAAGPTLWLHLWLLTPVGLAAKFLFNSPSFF